MKFPWYQFEIDGRHIGIGFKVAGYSYVQPVAHEYEGKKWSVVSNDYWTHAKSMDEFVRWEAEQREEWARRCAEKWAKYRKGWE